MITSQKRPQRIRKATVWLRQNLDRARTPLLCFLAELSGTAVAIFLGSCTSLSLRITLEQGQTFATFGVACWAWGLAFMAGNFLTARVSGAHLNPVLSIAYGLVRGMPFLRCILYIAAQMTGGFIGGSMAYLVYRESIKCANLDTRVICESLYAGPTPTLGHFSAFSVEFVATSLMIIMVSTLCEGKTQQPGPDVASIKVGLSNTLIMMALGYPTGPTMNPARDNGPRLVAAIVGADNVFEDGFWWYGAWIAPTAGAVLGVFLHDKLLAPQDVLLDEEILPVAEKRRIWPIRSHVQESPKLIV